MTMALTRAFKDTIMARARQDPEFRQGLLTEAVECLLAGDVDAGKILLRDYVNATIGFSELGRLTNKKDSSLMRMLGPKGNPASRNMFEIIAQLQIQEGIRFKVGAVR